ncbi:hypothetical protein A374_00754 [Fictibacillus macauensis ZFHKF-1]|uniref:Uncharacterized protein n=1 Tax=Fictibacillus macauensis ZFHKF-1 TaxID=1196324 RepID=I8J6B5_9BACL|nr:hypothetical protein [Fictibacillus macauensis]EIT87356.1 hypothetical protein A374_00754 [Fictibacillus macauensis ZFHKF-1]
MISKAFSPLTTVEYRLVDESFTPLYYVENIDRLELFCRRNCNYFVLDQYVYEVVSTALENELFVIYLQLVEDDQPFGETPTSRALGIEVRLLTDDQSYPEMTYINCQTHLEAFTYLDNSFLYFQNKEYARVSAELDQNRKQYVLYVKLTGETL